MLIAGCASEDPQLLALRSRLLLQVEPESTTTIAAARETSVENPQVSFVGQIVPDESEAFAKGQAAFLVTEIVPEQEGHEGKEHADSCPFCKRRAANAPRVAVQFVDDSGEPLKIDARQLLGVQAGDTVVVQGEGRVIEDLGMFHVTANGIYLRPAGDRQ